MSAKVIITANYKGGVGKSTFQCLLARYLRAIGKTVLMIDEDLQNSTTFHFVNNQDELEGRSLFYALSTGDIRANIFTTDSGIDLVASSFLLSELRTISNNKLKQLFESSGIKEDYDFILIDTPPGLDVFSYIAAYVADVIILPYTLSDFDIKSTAHAFQKIVENLDKDPTCFVSVANMVNGRITEGEENINRQFLEMAKSYFDDLHEGLFSDFRIPLSAPLKKAMARGEIISAAQNKKAVYDALCDLFEHITNTKRPTNF